MDDGKEVWGLKPCHLGTEEDKEAFEDYQRLRIQEGVTGCGAQEASLGGIHRNRLLGPLAKVLHFGQARPHTLHSVVCSLAHVLSPLQTGISTKWILHYPALWCSRHSINVC